MGAKLTTKAVEITFIGLLLCFVALQLTIYYLKEDNPFPINMEKIEFQTTPSPGKVFVVDFYFTKTRDDCHSPKITRSLVGVRNGSFANLIDSRVGGRVIQYPISKPGDLPYKFRAYLKVPRNFKRGQSVMITEVCYTCNGQRLCPAFSSGDVIVE